MSIDLRKYTQFVEAVTSIQSNNFDRFMNGLANMNVGFENETHAVHPSLLITAALGMCGESGEFSEIVKKLLFQGKPLDESVEQHLMKELGDVIFYWITACRALQVDPNRIIEQNIAKLESRYPGGHFKIEDSENRSEHDI